MVNDEVKQCYKIEDDEQALSCVKNLVKQSQGSCQPRMVLLVQEGCSGCAEEKIHYKDDIASGLVKMVDITTSEGKEIAKKNSIYAVPALLIVDCNNLAIE